jgi:flagellar basal body rod protein FlgG
MSTGPLDRIGGALRYWERRQQAMSHNLANASTDGYRAQRVFGRLDEAGVLQASRETDFTPGAVSATGRVTDVAIEGEGFLVVETERGERHTRAGALQLDRAGALVDAFGNRVLGQNGPLVVPEGELRIGVDGVVSVEGQEVGRLRVERPADDARVVREGGVYFSLEGDVEAVSTGDMTVRAGHLEDANLNPVSSMVEMMEIQRAYAALQRSTHVVDGVMDTVANRLGRLS